MENGDIRDAQITASSEFDGNHAAKQGRLNFLAVPGKAGSWSARTNDVNQWIQVKLPGYTKITRFATQGRNAFNQWVKQYKLEYSEDGVSFHYYHEPGQSAAKVLRCLQRYNNTNNLFSDALKLVIHILGATRRQQGASLKCFSNVLVLVMST